MYKSQLQEYAQKAGLMHPTYDHVKEGASHEPRFKSTVWVNNQSYESSPGFSTVRSAEHAAAKVALDFLQKSQTSGVVPSSVHESGLCKNLLQEFAQKNGYPLPQYKIMRQGEEHSLVFAATVEIAGVSYSGGGAKSKKEAEIKAARTALLAIQATQPANGLFAVEPRPLLAQAQPGQIANFVKSHSKRKKRGRVNPSLIDEPLATRKKQCLGLVAGPVQPSQMHQMHQMPQVPQVSQIPNILHVPPINQVAQIFPVNPVGYSGKIVMPVEWTQELGVCTRAPVVFSEPMQVGNDVAQDTAMTKSESGTIPTGVKGTEPTLVTKVLNVENCLTVSLGNSESTVVGAQGTTVKAEFAKLQQVPLLTDAAKDSQVFNIVATETTNFASKDYTEKPVTTELKEIVTVTGVHVSPASTSEDRQVSTLMQEKFPASQVDQVSAPITAITRGAPVPATPHNSVGAQELFSLANGQLQSEILSDECRD